MGGKARVKKTLFVFKIQTTNTTTVTTHGYYEDLHLDRKDRWSKFICP